MYLIVIFGTRYIMRNREPFSLFIPLNMWNFLMAGFSIITTLNILPELFFKIINHGYINSFCYRYESYKGESGYWVWIFTVSKLFEFIDTIFIVLRKRPLIFLHCYYLLRSLKIRLPAKVPIIVTSMQIIQFVAGFYGFTHMFYVLYWQKIKCEIDTTVLNISMFMDLSFLLLFINYFVQTYILRGGKEKFQFLSKFLSKFIAKEEIKIE
ncbi:hypothetical protein WR25_17421 [Diploscapter pachys]|uniref:Elongation of very long chain fatty acids protein n=1 Tax=Diploscapter pachys TaxID=2018661 RepID=A0A2A2KU70_9BILA|nr:hypothetical protein WR25_17421 [Diploscapter pachys]